MVAPTPTTTPGFPNVARTDAPGDHEEGRGLADQVAAEGVATGRGAEPGGPEQRMRRGALSLREGTWGPIRPSCLVRYPLVAHRTESVRTGATEKVH